MVKINPQKLAWILWPPLLLIAGIGAGRQARAYMESAQTSQPQAQVRQATTSELEKPPILERIDLEQARSEPRLIPTNIPKPPKQIVLDAGHGGKDPGATYKDVNEEDIVLNVALKARELLEARGYNVHLTRDSDELLKLKQRADFANNLSRADAFISIHTNAAKSTKARGAEAYSYPNATAQDRALTQALYDSIHRTRKCIDSTTPNRGTKTKDLSVLRNTQTIPSSLVELGFGTNQEDHKILRSEQYSLAKSLADGVDNFFGN